MFLGWDAWMLGLDATAVVGLRLMKLAAFDAESAAETQKMVTEKVAAAMELQVLAITGALGRSPTKVIARSLRHYGPKVRANRRRLEKR